MCGIAGIFDLKGQRAADPVLLRRMTDSIAHRGPDDAGYLEEPGVGLGHRRLSIIDLSGGHQPIFNEDGSIAVVYNGEIYNFAELAQELAERGHRFRTRCDTEVIVHAYEEWGADCVTRFRGMFAFAVYDRAAQRLFLARDRLGIKPLFHAVTDDGFLLFGSELKALLAHPGLRREIDPLAVEDFLALGYVPETRCIYKGVSKLAPGHVLMAERGREPVTREYWDMQFSPEAVTDEAAAAEELRHRLEEAVRIRLVAEVPLGAFLSGGVDSSAVVAMMARTQADPVNSCAISFGERDYDESRYAAMVAERYGANHRSRVVDPDDFDLVSMLPRIYDEPFADSSALPTWRVCEMARRHVTVALSGDGGDEVFAGYRRYRWHRYEEHVRAFLPQAIRGPLFGTLGRLYPKMDWAPKPLRAKSTFEAVARSSADGYFHSVSVLTDGVRLPLYTDAFRRELQGYNAREVIRDAMRRAPTDDPLSMIQYADMKTYLPGDILTKVDRASMAHALEVRVPLLDHPFVEWTGSLPSALKLRGREGKYIFKKALEPLLPDDVLYRPKMGFAVPIGSWIRGPLRKRVETALLEGSLADCGMFDRSRIATMLERHASGVGEHGAAIWSLLMFAGFLSDVHMTAPEPRAGESRAVKAATS